MKISILVSTNSVEIKLISTNLANNVPIYISICEPVGNSRMK